MSHAALDAGPPAARQARSDSDLRTTRRWAVGVLSLATVVLLAYSALLVSTAWILASGWSAVTSGGAVSVDVLGLGADLAPALLVGWCTGLAAGAALAGGQALGARTAGIAAGILGSACGATVLALTGLL